MTKSATKRGARSKARAATNNTSPTASPEQAAAAQPATKSRALPCVPGAHAKWVVEPDGSRTEYVWDKNCNAIRKDLYRPSDDAKQKGDAIGD